MEGASQCTIMCIMLKRFRIALLASLLLSYLPLATPAQAAGCDSSAATSTLSMRVPRTGSYASWFRFRKTTAGISQAAVEIGGVCQQLRLDAATAGTWYWTNKSPALTNVVYKFSSTRTTVVKFSSLDEVQIDRVILLRLGESCSDNSSTPSGLGDNCLAAPTTATTASASSEIIDENPIILSGTHAALPKPTIDQGTVSQINYYIDAILVASTPETEIGYVDSTRLANGPHDLTTELVSIDGKLQQSSRKVSVRNDQSVFAPVTRFISRYRRPIIYIFFAFMSVLAALVAYIITIKRRRGKLVPIPNQTHKTTSGLPLVSDHTRHQQINYIGGMSIVFFAISGLVLGNASAALWRNYSAAGELESGTLAANAKLSVTIVRDATASASSFVNFAFKTAPMPMPATPTPAPSPAPGVTPTATPKATNAPTPTPTPSMPGMTKPVAPADFLPSGSSSSQLLIDTGGAIPALSGDGTGDFRVVCRYTHMNYDDPIVYPGQPGLSHLHSYFGNTVADASSTHASLRAGGNSTCDGGIANRSAYWAPALLNASLKPVPIDYGYIYYKSGYRSVAPSSINNIPDGLKMIAGSGVATAAQSGEIVSWSCESTPGISLQSIPQSCGQNSYIIYTITFPQCWNGRDLDSVDHKSHMAYPTYGVGCPATYPVAVPVISLHIRYRQTTVDTSGWKLASDSYTISSSQPGGLSAHADFMEAWDPTIRDEFTLNCIKAARDCGVRDLGDGRILHMLPIP